MWGTGLAGREVEGLGYLTGNRWTVGLRVWSLI